ncbi:MAG: M28 family peptidase [Planctomycetia bacterium]|nr:M28 family peptidase [Planctomycetia bacterium]
MFRLPRFGWYPFVAVVVCAAGAAGIALIDGRSSIAPADSAAAAPLKYEAIPFDGAAAFKHLEELCALGPRPSGSKAMTAQQELIVKHFTALGADVRRQTFQVRHPVDGTPVEMSNLIIAWNPTAKERYLVCTHYDTRPFPDQDRVNPRGTFVGANDGGSSSALLMELGRHMQGLRGKNGVDFIYFDGEELVFSETDRYFLGSEHFAANYRAEPPGYRYRQGLLLDMVGDANLAIRQEQNSVKLARYVVGDVWGAASRLGVREFEQRAGPTVRDDHLPLNEIARIPTADVIDFDYPYWHTEADTPDKCSAASLEKVGRVVYEWLRANVNR